MDLQKRLDYITGRLDEIWEKYKNSPGFNHPIYPERSPSKQAWPQEFPNGDFYYWRFKFDVGDTKDTSGLRLQYFPDSNSYRIMFGKTYNGTDEETSDLNHILSLFESCIKNHIMGSRPHKEN